MAVAGAVVVVVVAGRSLLVELPVGVPLSRRHGAAVAVGPLAAAPREIDNIVLSPTVKKLHGLPTGTSPSITLTAAAPLLTSMQ